MYLKVASKIWCHFVSNLHRYDTISAHVPKRVLKFALEKPVYRNGLYISDCNSRNIVNVSLCLVPFLGRQKGVTFCRIVRPANRDWACETERCHTLSNKTSLQ